MRPLVLYHDNCPDGFTAAWAVWRTLGDGAEYRGVNYGSDIPAVEDLKDRRVILVDFSYPRHTLDKVAAVARQVEVYDHHKTAEEDLRYWADEAPETRRVVFDMERSGAGIAWDSFHIGARPKLIHYVEDRDLWRWRLASSREVSEYIFSVPRTFESWSEAADDVQHRFGQVVATGLILLRNKQERVKAMCKHVRWMTLAEHHMPVVNVSWDFSDVGEYLLAQLDVPAAGYYFDRADKRQWGFRSRDAVDVSAICKQYGGGGHKNAAGFQSEIGWEPR